MTPRQPVVEWPTPSWMTTQESCILEFPVQLSGSSTMTVLPRQSFATYIPGERASWVSKISWTSRVLWISLCFPGGICQSKGNIYDGLCPNCSSVMLPSITPPIESLCFIPWTRVHHLTSDTQQSLLWHGSFSCLPLGSQLPWRNATTLGSLNREMLRPSGEALRNKLTWREK